MSANNILDLTQRLMPKIVYKMIAYQFKMKSIGAMVLAPFAKITRIQANFTTCLMVKAIVLQMSVMIDKFFF